MTEKLGIAAVILAVAVLIRMLGTTAVTLQPGECFDPRRDRAAVLLCNTLEPTPR